MNRRSAFKFFFFYNNSKFIIIYHYIFRINMYSFIIILNKIYIINNNNENNTNNTKTLLLLYCKALQLCCFKIAFYILYIYKQCTVELRNLIIIYILTEKNIFFNN